MRSRTSPMAVLLFFVAFAGCTRSASPRAGEKATRPTPAPGTLASAASFSQVYPLADGCSYVHAFDDTLWYICGRSAARVSGLTHSNLAEFYPLADGSALVLDDVAQKLYSLRGAEASEVTEGSPSPPATAAGNLRYLSGFHFVTSAANARRAADAEPR